MAEQSKAEAPFVSDASLGHTLPAGKEFIGESDYISLEEMTRQTRKSGKKLVINIGDSSTSGWDSDVVGLNRERLLKGLPLLSAFFRYRTYADFLRDRIGHQFEVINAGVPAHTSLQGKKRLEQLLRHFSSAKFPIEYVTVYYGNNDCVWEMNRGDSDWIEGGFLRRIHIWIRRMRANRSLFTRTTPKEYQQNMEDIANICLKVGAVPIFLQPVVPLYWKPGTRVVGETLPRKTGYGSREAYRLLDEALRLWNIGLSHKHLKERLRLLEEAKEKDFVVPRIKNGYSGLLSEMTSSRGLPYVSIENTLDRRSDDKRYFKDYCHPCGEANSALAEEIAKVIGAVERSPWEKTRMIVSAKNPMNNWKKIRGAPSAIPTDNYTLY